MDQTLNRTDILRIKLAQLAQEHRDLDAAIAALHDGVSPNMLTLQRLKRQKLRLKDDIKRIEDELTPDIIA